MGAGSGGAGETEEEPGLGGNVARGSVVAGGQATSG